MLKIPLTRSPLFSLTPNCGEAIKELNEARAVPVKLKEKTLWIRTDIEGNTAKIFRAAGVQIPKKLLKVCKEGEGLKLKN